MPTKTHGERLASLERGLSDHERACEERLAAIKSIASGTDEKIDGLASATTASIDKLRDFIVGLILAVCGFALLTLVAIVLRALALAS